MSGHPQRAGFNRTNIHSVSWETSFDNQTSNPKTTQHKAQAHEPKNRSLGATAVPPIKPPYNSTKSSTTLPLSQKNKNKNKSTPIPKSLLHITQLPRS